MSRTERSIFAETPYRIPKLRQQVKQMHKAILELKSFASNRDKVKANQRVKGYDDVYCSAYRERLFS